MEFKKMVTITLYARQKKRQLYRTDFWTLWEKVRVGWSERIASKHVYYQVWNRSPVQVGCMRQVLRAGVLGWDGREVGGGSGWGTHVNPWLIHVNVWKKQLHYCKVISLQLIKINEKKRGWESGGSDGRPCHVSAALLSFVLKGSMLMCNFCVW